MQWARPYTLKCQEGNVWYHFTGHVRLPYPLPDHGKKRLIYSILTVVLYSISAGVEAYGVTGNVSTSSSGTVMHVIWFRCCSQSDSQWMWQFVTSATSITTAIALVTLRFGQEVIWTTCTLGCINFPYHTHRDSGIGNRGCVHFHRAEQSNSLFRAVVEHT